MVLRGWLAHLAQIAPRICGENSSRDLEFSCLGDPGSSKRSTAPKPPVPISGLQCHYIIPLSPCTWLFSTILLGLFCERLL
ncbi:uncharacterized protein AKAW2_50218A [Aspergillus luchuensis]|uniref:Uncharacterized protein n=1 Tax=Aspergillus kawachii TaxID=1069201 RepID=A0A7R8A016_ASPKA|nr:uncharacterized protein AKAW2_50218A [Aspergillus luchuensis]BCR99876.1 hypothetical protein AKAW2_50218A [Aspergillus luchuensis]